MKTSSTTPRQGTVASNSGNPAVRLCLITVLALTGCLMPRGIQAQYVGEMDGFWRRATMVDIHLKGGGGLGIIPDYVSDPGTSFPYIKRPFPTEYPHADSLVLVRTLGGWRTDLVGKGEAAAYSNIEQADVVTWNGTNLQFDKAKFIDRIRPFVDAGYHDLTIVLDNIPWSLSGPHASEGNYGNKGHAQYPSHMYWVGRNVSQWLVEEFGAIAQNFTFRYGTETEWGGRYTGTAWNYFQEYDNVARGLHFNLPNAKLGPGNFYKLNDSEQTMKLKDFLGYIQSNGSPGVAVNFLSASRYLKTSTTGVDESPAAAVGATMDYFDSLQALHPTVLADADWKIDEFGFVGGSQPGNQPGTYGGALVFNMICGLLERGIDEMQHWLSPMVYDGNMSGGDTSLWTSLSSIFTIFDHLKGGQAYVRSITPLLASAEGMSLVVKKDQYTYVILSAANVSRSTQPTQNFTYSFPVSEATFTDPKGVKVEYLSLDRASVPHDILRNDLAAAGLLVSPFSGNADWVSDVNSMAGTAGRTYLNQNFAKYSQAYIDSMTLKGYSGSLTLSGSQFQLAVQNMRTPSIMVFRLSPGSIQVSPVTIYANAFQDAAGTEAKNSVAEVNTVADYTAGSYLTATDGAGKLHATASNASANYRFRMHPTPLSNDGKWVGVRAKIVMRAPTTEWVGISFGENGAGQVLHADTNATWLMVRPDWLRIFGGEGTSGSGQSYTGTHAPGDLLNLEYTYYFDKTVDLYLNGQPIAVGLPVNYINAATGQAADPVIQWAGITLRAQQTAANGGAYIESFDVELVPSTVIYANTFADAAGTAASNSVPEINTIPEFSTGSYLTATDGTGKLHASGSNASANFRFRINPTPLNNDLGLSAVRATIVMRAPATEWVGISFGENGAGQVLHADANATWLMIRPTRFEVRGGEAAGGSLNTYNDTHAAGDILTIEYIYYFDKTVDVYLNGQPVVVNLPINYINSATGQAADPVISWAGVTLRAQPTAANGGAYIDSLIIDVLP